MLSNVRVYDEDESIRMGRHVLRKIPGILEVYLISPEFIPNDGTNYNKDYYCKPMHIGVTSIRRNQ